MPVSVRVRVRVLVSVPVLVLSLIACGAPSPPLDTQSTFESAASRPPHASSGTPLERYFPLVDSHIYSYATMTETGDPGALVLTARRAFPTHGELRASARARRFTYVPEGVVSADSGAFVLKAPLVPGNSWPGEHGGATRIDAVELSVTVPAGSFAGCVRTVEERGGDVPVRYTTVFCPDIGVVVLEVTSGMGLERAELKSYAPPVFIGPDGVVTTTRPAPR
ncbi:MAG: hypothetical protein HUU21_20785 [Polyangiaceae bacterium]|nr:hypothetical protein [Polyangiaceae bacterium]